MLILRKMDVRVIPDDPMITKIQIWLNILDTDISRLYQALREAYTPVLEFTEDTFTKLSFMATSEDEIDISCELISVPKELSVPQLEPALLRITVSVPTAPDSAKRISNIIKELLPLKLFEQFELLRKKAGLI